MYSVLRSCVAVAVVSATSDRDVDVDELGQKIVDRSLISRTLVDLSSVQTRQCAASACTCQSVTAHLVSSLNFTVVIVAIFTPSIASHRVDWPGTYAVRSIAPVLEAANKRLGLHNEC